MEDKCHAQSRLGIELGTEYVDGLIQQLTEKQNTHEDSHH